MKKHVVTVHEEKKPNSAQFEIHTLKGKNSNAPIVTKVLKVRLSRKYPQTWFMRERGHISVQFETTYFYAYQDYMNKNTVTVCEERNQCLLQKKIPRTQSFKSK